MDATIDTLRTILLGAWDMFLDVAPFLILGYLIAGAIKVLLPGDWIARKLGGRGLGPVLKAGLMGVPLPLCSCGVIPAAMGIRKEGASRGATLSFLVSTPETGVDSIAVTYAILGPILAVIRPVAALLNAITCGFVADLVVGHRDETDEPEEKTCGCCGSADRNHRHTWKEKTRKGLHFSFVELLGDTMTWLLIGVLLAGVIGTILRPELVREHVSSEAMQLLLMLVISIPLYICATASTPVAAALVVAGFSPGAALVLLLAGPATNVATLLVAARFLGKAAAAIYVASIAATSLMFGFLLNAFMPNLGEQVRALATGEEHMPAWLMYGSAAILLALMANVVIRKLRRPSGSCCADEAARV